MLQLLLKRLHFLNLKNYKYQFWEGFYFMYMVTKYLHNNEIMQKGNDTPYNDVNLRISLF